MKIYCIEVMTLGGLYPTTKISQEAYNSYDKAVKFCEGRAERLDSASNRMHSREGVSIEISTIALIRSSIDALPRGSEY